MKLREFISEAAVYQKIEEEIRHWVESAYEGLSIDFYPKLEIVRIDPKKRFNKSRVRKIVEVVNLKIGSILEQYAEEIYIAERLERIYARHPGFDLEVESINDIKRNEQFLGYLKELII